ncbi:MAG: hypothetical protein HRU20_06165 [Pseudomonadales bacterium]|nr:hypothetical protein [Pseudomonadales bacterium]
MLSRRHVLYGTAIPAMYLAGAYCPQVFSAVLGSSQYDSDELQKLIVETPQDQLLLVLVKQIKQGLSYEVLLAALVMAGAKHIEPYPTVGFQYHVLMMLSAVYKSLQNSPFEDRWLHLLWAADAFKSAQQDDTGGGEWQMSPAPVIPLSGLNAATEHFVQAMETWDAEAADVAIVQLIAQASPAQIFDLLFYYGARDFRDIGHKCIAVSNSHRLLQRIGWQYAETVLRSTVYALLNHHGEPNPAFNELTADASWRENRRYQQVLHLSFYQQWMAPLPENNLSVADRKMTLQLLVRLRKSDGLTIGEYAFELLNRGTKQQVLWDAVFLAAGEIIASDSGIIGVHANTSVNALYYAYQHVDSDKSRQLFLLQALSYISMFNDLLFDGIHRIQLDTMAEISVNHQVHAALAEIFADISTDRLNAAGKLLFIMNRPALMQQAINPFMALARHYTLYHNSGFHDFKFTEAMFENAAHISSVWRPRYLSASVFYLNGSHDQINKVVHEAYKLLQ